MQVRSADYVVVGAGTAGCAIARRLADEAAPGTTVLLIEAGRVLKAADDVMHDMVHDPMQCKWHDECTEHNAETLGSIEIAVAQLSSY